MVSDIHAAKEIQETLAKAAQALEKSIIVVEERCCADEYQRYKAIVGQVIAKMLFEIVEPLYEAHPILKPMSWDEN